MSDLGLDFGIKTTITTSEGEKYDITVRETGRLKGLQKKLARQKKGSRGWFTTLHIFFSASVLHICKKTNNMHLRMKLYSDKRLAEDKSQL